MQILRYLIFLPNITFSLVPAEIFPWALVYSFFKERKIYIGLIPVLLLIFFSSFYTLYLTNGSELSNVFRVSFAYLNPLILFVVLIRADEQEIIKIINCLKNIFFGLLILGTLQTLNLIDFLDPIFKTMVPRSSAGSLADYDRGVTLLSSEPSRAGLELLLIYACYRACSSINFKKIILLDFIVICFQIFIIQSATGVLVSLLFFLYLYKYIALLFSPFIILFILESASESRLIYIATELIQSVTFLEFMNLLIDFSGFRGTSVLSAYYYGVNNFFGGGLGLWEVSSIEALKSLGIDPGKYTYYREYSNGLYLEARPEAYMANVALDFGILGLCIYFIFLYPFIKMIFLIGKVIFPISLLFFFIIFLSGSVGNPVPWIAFALTIQYFKFKDQAIQIYEK